MKIVCSEEMPFAAEAFQTLGEVVMRPGREISAGDVADARILAVRSTTRIDEALLGNSSVEFVGTATIGFNHIDADYLARRGIPWRAAPGCNANSVSEYVTAALLHLACERDLRLDELTIGIVGVGNVGALVAAKAEALGMRVLRNDPPRARARATGDRSQEAGGEPIEWWELDDLLAEADVVTLHVPLTREGPDSTFHMADDSMFRRMKRGAVFINSARGAVVDTPALIQALDAGVVSSAIIDTWEGEPLISGELLSRAALGTPHIAGYSFDGKVAGTVMVYRAACGFLGVEPQWDPSGVLPASEVPALDIDTAGRTDEDVLADAVRAVYDIAADDAALRKVDAAGDAGRGDGFDRLRKEYRVRREFQFTQLSLRKAGEGLKAKITGLGFEFFE